ncbi:hypothetical protein HAX54_024332 [Datura stramonium]|uniref:Peptidase M16 C-terminal domain-containing protein n=1 Tax=Datura stramonium TaxID=4076 RepID=A0ABS8S5A9_DATST|nr:hypothetical protein [Datura stramonium]
MLMEELHMLLVMKNLSPSCMKLLPCLGDLRLGFWELIVACRPSPASEERNSGVAVFCSAQIVGISVVLVILPSILSKSLESPTAHKLMLAMLNGDERFVEPTPHSLQNLTLESVRAAVMDQFVSDNMEVSMVGDFSEEDIESCILDYLGTVFLKDTDERACAYIAGPAPNRWGFTFEGNDLFESVGNLSSNDHELEQGNTKLQERLRNHPLFFAIAMGLLVHKAVDACKNVLRGLHSNRIVPRELDRFSLEVEETDEGLQGVVPMGRGSSTVTRPTT